MHTCRSCTAETDNDWEVCDQCSTCIYCDQNPCACGPECTCAYGAQGAPVDAGCPRHGLPDDEEEA